MLKIFYLIVISISLSFSEYSIAQNFFDESFGVQGRLTCEIPKMNSGFSSISIQQDNNIVLTGWARDEVDTPSDIILIRLKENGVVDTLFNPGGIFTIEPESWEEAYSSIIQSDGKILVAGRYFNGNNWDFLIVRFNSNGSRDISFGENGIKILDLGSDDRAFDIEIQNDGQILICGFSNFNDWDFAISRFNQDGSIDLNFGNSGSVIINVGTYNDVAYSLKVQNDNKIIVCGWTYIFESWDFAFVRLNNDGSQDLSFGTDGIVTTDLFHLYNTSHSIAIQSDGKYIAAGYAFKPNSIDYDVLVVRYNLDGTVDRSFADDGFLLRDLNFSDDFVWAVAIDMEDRIVITGFTQSSEKKQIMILRFNADGSNDFSFGNNGVIQTNFYGIEEEARNVQIQSDGKILVAGHIKIGQQYKPFVLRLNTIYDLYQSNKNYLLQNFPNPFNSNTKIRYIIPAKSFDSIEKSTRIKIKVFDILGKEITTLLDKIQTPGHYEIDFNSKISGKHLSSGVYFYILEMDDRIETKKMILLR